MSLTDVFVLTDEGMLKAPDSPLTAGVGRDSAVHSGSR